METIKSYLQPILSRVPFWWIVGGLLVIELLSYSGHNFPAVNGTLFLVLTLATLFSSLWKLELGVGILLAELVMGSKGYLFSMEIGGVEISIRLALFLAVFLAYAVWIIRDKKIAFFSWSLWKPYLAVIILIGVGALIGYTSGNGAGNVFLDANGYLFIGLIGPATQAIQSREKVQMILGLLFAAVTALIVKTLLLVALFPQLTLLEFTLPGLYRWVRDTGVGEITLLENGFYRIFFQSHIYVFFLLFLLLPFIALQERLSVAWLKKTYPRILLLLTFFALMLEFISSSRSFWVATIATAGLFILWLLVKEKIGFKRTGSFLVTIGVLLALGYALLFGIINLPLPGNTGISAGSLVSDRAGDLLAEPAAASRWSLIRPLADASLEHPVLGSGLGATVTYISSDPRVLQDSPTGEYTTFAFEWGYLDILLKFGVLGFGIFLWLFIAHLTVAWHALKKVSKEYRAEILGLVLTLIFLAATHMFTPYLNHPLGLGWLAIVSVLLVQHKKPA